jgi:hypothetical protein
VLSSPVIDLAIGLTFVFGVTAALASFITELISRLLGLRGAYLLSGLRELVDDGVSKTYLTNVSEDYQAIRGLMQPASATAAELPTVPQAGGQASPPRKTSITAALLGGPILSSQGVAGQLPGVADQPPSRQLTLDPTRSTGRLPKMTATKTKIGGLWSQRRSLPSYISAKSFAEAVINLVVPDPQGQATMTDIEGIIGKLPPTTPFRQSLETLAKSADGDFSRFRTSVEQWYDDHMDRVSGWYKRHTAKITLAAGAIIVVLLNLNALTIGRTLYTENAVSAAVSAVAAKAAPSSCPTASQDCLADLESQLSAAAAAGLPIGWGTVRACTLPAVKCNWWDRRGIFSPYGSSGWQLVLVLVGFLIMIISLVPGAQFWFGLLTKLNTLRTTGPPPASVPSNPVSLTVVRPPVASLPAAAAVPAAAPSPAEQTPPQDAG